MLTRKGLLKQKNILPSSNSEVENFTEKEGQKISKKIVNIFYIINVNVCIYLIGKTQTSFPVYCCTNCFLSSMS